MSFITDKQTLDDLGLLGKFRTHSVFSIFNKVKTAGGERLLQEMFHHPLDHPDRINERSVLFRYFQDAGLSFPIDTASFAVAESYLSNSAAGNFPATLAAVARKRLMGAFLNDDGYALFLKGIRAAVAVLLSLRGLIRKLDIPLVEAARRILSDKRLDWLDKKQDNSFSLWELARFDHLLRHSMRSEMEQLMDTACQLDVYIAVGSVAREKGFSYGLALPSGANVLEAAALYHPALSFPVSNPIAMDRAGNLVFLTGANMAGKSTFMKAVGIAVYLAHMGFPLPAHGFRFSVRDGMFTSINVPDNIDMGYSHFYAEVLRVKKVAEEVGSGKNMLVIFDELFKGTNVKDAYDATLAVTKAFSKYRNCFFIISTHIIEVGEALKEERNILFRYLPTVMNGTVPTYTYVLTEGITTDRQGMIIIENEKILEVLYG